MTGRKNIEPAGEQTEVTGRGGDRGTVSDVSSVYFLHTVDEGEEGCKRCRNPDHGRCSFLCGTGFRGRMGVEKITFFLIQMDVRSSSPEYRLIISVLQGRDGEIRSMTGSI